MNKKRYVKNFEQFRINENEDIPEAEGNVETNGSEQEEKASLNSPNDMAIEKTPPFDELDEKGVTNKANLSS